ncbi:MAG: lipoprotein [Patescibacteria group bacterium]
MKKIIIFLFVLLFLAGCTNLHKQDDKQISQEISSQMFYCEEDSDCISVGCGCDGGPCETVVNKKFKSEWYHERRCPPSECLCQPFVSVYCKNNKCAHIMN